MGSERCKREVRESDRKKVYELQMKEEGSTEYGGVVRRRRH